jgi:hypothetical protein
MDYIVTTLDKDNEISPGIQRLHSSYDSYLKKLKDSDRLFVIESDSGPSSSPKQLLPLQDNIYIIDSDVTSIDHNKNYYGFPWKVICQHVQHLSRDFSLDDNFEKKYHVCHLNRRPAALRVLSVGDVMQLKNIVYSLYPYNEDHMSYTNDHMRNNIDIKTIYLNKNRVIINDEVSLKPEDDVVVRGFKIDRIRLSEDITKNARRVIGKKYHNTFFPECIFPPVEYFQSYVDYYQESTLTFGLSFTEKIVKNLIWKKPFIVLSNSGIYKFLEQQGFINYFNIYDGPSLKKRYKSCFNMVSDLCDDIGILSDFDVDLKAQHNFNRTMEIYAKYGDFFRFIWHIDFNGSIEIENTDIMDNFLELINDIDKFSY